MTEEEKTAALAEAEAKKAKEEEAKANLDNLSPEEKSKREAEEKRNIEIEEQLTQERERREKAEKALAELAFKKRKEKRQVVEPDIVEDEDAEDEEKPLTQKQFREVLAQERQAILKESQASLIKEKARSLAGSDGEAELIMEIHKNRNFPSYLSLDEQLEESFAIANRKRLLAQNAELKRALAGKRGTSYGAEGTHADPPASGEPAISPQDKSELSRLGYKWDGKFYSKKLKNGKTLFRDMKSKKSWVE